MTQYIPWIALVFNLVGGVVTIVWVVAKMGTTSAILAQQISHLAQAVADLKAELRAFDKHNEGFSTRLSRLEQACAVIRERLRIPPDSGELPNVTGGGR